MERMHDLAESFCSAHPSLATLDTLEQELADVDDAREAIAHARAALRSAARARPAPLNASAFANEFARALSARVWPAEVRLIRDDRQLRRVNRDATASMEFRRTAFSVADRLGERLLELFGADLLARPQIPPITLNVSAAPATNTILIEAVPGSPVRPAPRTVNELAHAVARAGGDVLEGHDDGRITLTLYGRTYAPEAR
jgi:hypothetical protein